ncbi:MAG TPA: PQQ-binding-like beta-propeller repeat protein [Acidimicrobiales bacterium]|nr:PQQ-binding-like beta-propeller repeat protein [Acidimicrobiales bacterium]
MDSDPVGVGDGFLVGVSGCVGFVETGGRLRWTVPGSLVDGARLGDTLVIAQNGEPSVLGVDATTGEGIWKRPDRALWSDVVAETGTAMLVGSSFDGSVTTVEASTGRATANQYGILPNDGRFLNAIVDDGLLVTAGHAGRKGRVVAADGSGRIVLDAVAGVFFPHPVAVVGDVIVLRASGITGGGVDAEPSTHLVGHDRTTGTERWRRVLPGLQAGPAVEVAGVVVVRLKGGLSGVDARSGVVRWSVAIGDDYESPMVVVGTDAVALGEPDGTVVVIEVADGRRRWSVRTEGQVAVLGALDGGVLLSANNPNFYRAFRVSDGTELWKASGPEAGAGSSRGSRRARMAFAGDTSATLVGLDGVVALRRQP